MKVICNKLNISTLIHSRQIAAVVVFILWTVMNVTSCKTPYANATQNKDYSFTVMQFNIWQEGTMAENGFQGIVDEIVFYKPDLIALVEVRNYKGVDFFKKVCDTLAARGLTYYYRTANDNGWISKYPILSYLSYDAPLFMHKVIVEINGCMIAAYSAHLDYKHYAAYLPRGYDGSGNNKLPAPIIDINRVLEEDAKSTRPLAIKAFVKEAQKDIQNNRHVVLAGDFNEASHLDWTERTKHLYNKNGAVIPWRSSTVLYQNGYKDSYRILFPNEKKYPGFTWVVAKPWLKDVDERDRIDFIYYYDDLKLKPIKSYLVGPLNSYVGRIQQRDGGKDKIRPPQSNWPSDHRALITHFVCSK